MGRSASARSAAALRALERRRSSASSRTRSLRQSGTVVNEADSEWMANDYGSQTFAETGVQRLSDALMALT